MINPESQVIDLVWECWQGIPAECSWDVGCHLWIVLPSGPGRDWYFTCKCFVKVFVCCFVQGNCWLSWYDDFDVCQVVRECLICWHIWLGEQ